MRKFKKTVVIALALSLIIPFVPSRSHAADDSVMMQNVFKDAFYGGAVGSLIGLGFMLLTEKPQDHLRYIAYGAGGGIIAGAAIGMASSTKALAEIEDGKITLNVPEVKTDIIQNKHDEKAEVVRTLSLLRYSF